MINYFQMIKNLRAEAILREEEIKRAEEHGIDLLKRVKRDLAIQLIYGLKEEEFDYLFGVEIINPNDLIQEAVLVKKAHDNPNTYNETKLERFRNLKGLGILKIELNLNYKTV
jgi:hypothetical protein